MSLSCTTSEINGDFSRKSPIFPTPVYLTPSLKGFSLEFGIGTGVKKSIMMGLPYGRKSFKIGLALQTQYRRVTDIQPSSHHSTAKTALTRCVARVKTYSKETRDKTENRQNLQWFDRLFDIRPGNKSGIFFVAWSLHGAIDD